MNAARSREPADVEKLSADVVVEPPDALPPSVTGPRLNPSPPPLSLVVAVLSVCEKPDCTSFATACCTSLTARLWLVAFVSDSVSSIDSVELAVVCRDQSTTATRVLSPGASATEWRRLPSVTPCANHDC